jgi:hypothetical protein
MNARISREFLLQAGLHFEDKFIISSYVFELYMDVQTEDPREQNIALERIKYLIDECFSNCVFVDTTEKKVIDAYTLAGMKVCPLPDKPYDQVIASVLLSKCNAITEGKLLVDEIKITSDISDNVSFYISIDDEIAFNYIKDTWWTENSTAITEFVKKSKREKVVSLKKDILDWVDLGLTWKAKEKKETQVVFIGTDHHPD